MKDNLFRISCIYSSSDAKTKQCNWCFYCHVILVAKSIGVNKVSFVNCFSFFNLNKRRSLIVLGRQWALIAATFLVYAIKIETKAGFPLGEFVRANKQKANVIGW